MNRIRNLKLRSLAAVILVAMHTQPLRACSVCYGQSDSPLARALNWGILALLVVLLGVLGGVTLFFVHVGRRAAANRAAETGESPNLKN